MKTFLVKQKFRLGGERFAIKDDRGEIAYQVEGSFFKIPKTFTIYDAAGEQVSQISKEILTLTVLEDAYADLVISLCVAIDYVEMLESQSH